MDKFPVVVRAIIVLSGHMAVGILCMSLCGILSTYVRPLDGQWGNFSDTCLALGTILFISLVCAGCIDAIAMWKRP